MMVFGVKKKSEFDKYFVEVKDWDFDCVCEVNK